MENIQDLQAEYYFAAINQQKAAQHYNNFVSGAGNHQTAEEAAVAAAAVYFIENPNEFSQGGPFDTTNFFFPNTEFTLAATAHSYTPSYGSPQSSIYESIDSSDYDVSDGYSSAGGSSGLSSPHLTTDVMFEEESLRRNSLQLSELSDEDLLYAFNGGFNSNSTAATTNTTAATTDNATSYNDYSQHQPIKMENPYLSDDNNSNINDGNNNGGGAGPMFSFIPATPITPTKAQAIADSVYGVISSPSQQQLISINEEPIVTSEINNDPISTSIGSRNTNNPASHSAKSSTTAHSHPQNSRSSGKNNQPKVATSTVSTTPTHQHRSHRKALPQEMAERLHTMNLAPPKPQRKSKTSAPFHCPYEDCTKTFTRQYNLKSHLRTHTDERPFLCGFQGCTRAFARQHDRKRHYNLHLGFKPHVCSHCGRAFARLDALNRHLRSDSGAPCAQATLPNGGEKKFKPVNM
ncbi:97_t:CDS:2 [Ambispora leptoticha]|uniref:97_t:CDS:1 n=1 Tax=Ambispora leptoticha TaxID=144679 RepID=A0A9N9F3H4_9GLOM|nr:97_t:CDS:2 [Ambispora leptoticha]